MLELVQRDDAAPFWFPSKAQSGQSPEQDLDRDVPVQPRERGAQAELRRAPPDADLDAETIGALLGRIAEEQLITR